MEEDFALVSMENKGNGNKSQGEEGENKMDLMKVKCFHCHEHGHYAKNCPQKKERKKELTLEVVGEALASYPNLISLSLHAWLTLPWEECCILIAVPHSI